MQEAWRLAYLTRSQLGSFRRRVSAAEECLRGFLVLCEAPYAGFSGGKDSAAILSLLAGIGRTDVPIFTQADDLDWPEKRTFCDDFVRRLNFSDYSYCESEVSARERFAAIDFAGNFAIRGTFSHVVKRYVSTRGRVGAILGLRAQESAPRRIVRATKGLTYSVKSTRDGATMRCIPIADWSGEDVMALLLSRGVPLFHVYEYEDDLPPHERRMSWPVNPEFPEMIPFIRRHHPGLFRNLQDLNPHVRRFA